MDAVLATGVSIEQFVANLAEYFRNLLFLKSGIAKDTLLGYAPRDFDPRVLDSLTAAQIEKAIEMLLTLYRNIRFSLNQRFELELLLTGSPSWIHSSPRLRSETRWRDAGRRSSSGPGAASTPRSRADAPRRKDAAADPQQALQESR